MVRCRGRGSDGLTSGDHEGMGLWPDFLFGGVPGRALLRPACGLVLLGAGAGCVGQLPLEEMPAHATAAAHQGVDWSRAKPARIIVTEFIFAHGEPSFKKGVPYRLELRNTGEEAHMFEARAFFRSIAVRDVEIVETASIGGLKDPNRAWKPAPERLPEVGPEEEDEAEGKDGKAGKGKKGREGQEGRQGEARQGQGRRCQGQRRLVAGDRRRRSEGGRCRGHRGGKIQG